MKLPLALEPTTSFLHRSSLYSQTVKQINIVISILVVIIISAHGRMGYRVTARIGQFVRAISQLRYIVSQNPVDLSEINCKVDL